MSPPNRVSLWECIKQLQALVAGILPFFEGKLQILPFLNPTIAENFWPISSILAIAGSILVYNLTRHQKYQGWGIVIAIIGFVGAFVSVGVLVWALSDIFPSSNIDVLNLTAQICFVSVFVGIGLVLGLGSWAIIS